jgi:hypothetical protein
MYPFLSPAGCDHFLHVSAPFAANPENTQYDHTVNAVTNTEPFSNVINYKTAILLALKVIGSLEHNHSLPRLNDTCRCIS